MIFAVAASVLIVAGVATWLMLHRQGQQMVRVVVDLRDRSMARGTEPYPTEPPLEIPHKVSSLEIYLPLGSGDGPYDVRIAAGNGHVLSSSRGVAGLKAGVTSLHVDVNLPSTSPGLYALEIRKAGSEWSSYPMRIQ